jgi:hypothetical protein
MIFGLGGIALLLKKEPESIYPLSSLLLSLHFFLLGSTRKRQLMLRGSLRRWLLLGIALMLLWMPAHAHVRLLFLILIWWYE